MTQVNMEKIVSLAKRRGFVFPSSEIYGGFASSYDYGPMGVELIKNIKDLWWKQMVYLRTDVEGIDGGIITHPRIWEASGHVDNFIDPLVDCKSCKKRFRADKILEDKLGVEEVAGKSLAEMGKMLFDNEIACEHCGAIDWTEVRRFNLLVECTMGVAEGEKKSVYLRGETCQTIYVNFENVLQTARQKVPFGIAQVGKSFRNEITPGNFIFRTREFEQMEMQFFVHPGEADKWYEYWKEERYNYILNVIGLKKENVRWRQHKPEERAHYAKDAWDIEYNSPFGWAEMEGVHNRGDWDLTRHSQFSGHNLEYYDQELGEKYFPWVIETAGGVGRMALMVLLDAYTEEEVGEGDKKEMRVVLKFDKKVAPIKVAVLPLMKKEMLTKAALNIFNELKSEMVCQYDETQSIGKRYRRQDEIGTPYCVTVDFDTIEKDQAVTVRDRDSMQQVRVRVDELKGWLVDKFK
ncbi:MAG TPA: glycine--tRNA ligase [bacterium]|nr:glycine--tRNA ligase [bacterium]